MLSKKITFVFKIELPPFNVLSNKEPAAILSITTSSGKVTYVAILESDD
jgi:hypothetical protein